MWLIEVGLECRTVEPLMEVAFFARRTVAGYGQPQGRGEAALAADRRGPVGGLEIMGDLLVFVVGLLGVLWTWEIPTPLGINRKGADGGEFAKASPAGVVFQILAGAVGAVAVLAFERLGEGSVQGGVEGLGRAPGRTS